MPVRNHLRLLPFAFVDLFDSVLHDELTVVIYQRKSRQSVLILRDLYASDTSVLFNLIFVDFNVLSSLYSTIEGCLISVCELELDAMQTVVKVVDHSLFQDDGE